MGKDETVDSEGRASAPKRKRTRAAAEDEQPQAAAKKASTSTAAAVPVVHWAEAFPAAHVKKILQDGEPDLGGLLQPATRLITACSALFVRNLVSSCRTSKQEEGSNSTTALKQLDALRQAVAAEPLLEGVLDGLDEDDNYKNAAGRGSLLTSAEWKPSGARPTSKTTKKPAAAAAASDPKKQTKQQTKAIRKPKAKTTLKDPPVAASAAAAAGDGGLVEEALKIAGDSNNAAAGMIMPMNNRQEVVVDEEDYD